jgi:hypothetical protein
MAPGYARTFAQVRSSFNPTHEATAIQSGAALTPSPFAAAACWAWNHRQLVAMLIVKDPAYPAVTLPQKEGVCAANCDRVLAYGGSSIAASGASITITDGTISTTGASGNGVFA